MMKFILPAACASLMAVSSAWALPSAPPMPSLQSAEPGFARVEDRREGDMRRGPDRRQFTPGRRYDRAPAGWHRHGDRRPSDWHTRGCIMAGPIWFCP